MADHGLIIVVFESGCDTAILCQEMDLCESTDALILATGPSEDMARWPVLTLAEDKSRPVYKSGELLVAKS